MSNTSTIEDWVHFFEEEEAPPSSPAAATTPGGKFSPAASSQLSLRSCMTKHVRKRTRAPRTTPPATFLNANTSNFRELVQQFTGRPTTPFSSASHLGPLTINFEVGVQQYHHPHHHNMISSLEVFGSNYQDHHHHHHHHHRRSRHGQHNMFVIDNSGNANSVDGFPMEKSSEELNMNCFSTGNDLNNDGHFW